MTTSSTTWHIIANKHAGSSGKAEQLTDELATLLQEQDVPYTLHQTQGVGHAGRIGVELTSGDSTIVAVVGGDGTLHELINGVRHADADEGSSSTHHSIDVVLVPAGTANAVYHSLFPSTCEGNTADFDRFLSVKAALTAPASPSSSSASSSLVPLSVAAVSILPSQHDEPSSQTAQTLRTYYSHVVTSTALHAHILETASSAEMRKANPGVERFRKAAEQHFGTLYPAKLTLLPVGPGGLSGEAGPVSGVQRWSLRSQTWETVSTDSVTIEDHFAYFVAALVDRFEPKFRIAPHSTSGRDRPAEAIDIVLVRAGKDDSKATTSARLLKVLNTAYDDGKHILLTEDSMGDGGAEGADASSEAAVVEYYRVSGFVWQPRDEASRLACVDGTTFSLEDGQSLKCSVDGQDHEGKAGATFRVYA